MWQLHQNKKSIALSLFVVSIACVPVFLGLIHPGFFVSDDGTWMIVRFSAFYDALRHGEFPVRFLPRINFGYGYPVADFLYPLFLYIGIPIKLLGFHFVTTIKIILGLSLLFSGIFSFLWLRTKFSEISSVVGAIIYTLFPYHVWDVYKRGSVGEVLALAIVPFIFLQIEKRNISLAGFAVALLIPAHNVVALLFLPVIFLYVLIKKYSLKEICMLFLIGFGISAFFWLPALIDKQYTIFDTIAVSDFKKYFLGIHDFFLFGIITVIVLVHSFIILKNRDGKSKEGLFFWVLTIVSVFLTLPFSNIFWQYVPGTSFIQFPFRFLSLTALGISFLGTMAIDNISKKYIWNLAVLYVCIIYISAWNLFTPKTFQDLPDAFYTTNVNSTTVQNEYMPIWVKQLPTSLPPEKVKIIKGNGEITDIMVKGINLQFKTTLRKDSIIRVNTVYFPGWKVLVDKKQTSINYDNPYGVMQFPVVTGNHIVQTKFTETTERLLSDMISVAAVIFASGIFLAEKKKQKGI